MTKYREIIRLQSLMISERTIAESCGVSRNTVSKVLRKAKESKISWPLEPEMTDAGKNVIMYGGTGTGKTMLSILIGISACNQEIPVRFYRTAGLINLFSESQSSGKLTALKKKLNSAQILILDEFGYVPYDRTGSQLLFDYLSEIHEQKSVILNTNLEFSQWVNVLYDQRMTTALIGRLTHHVELILFPGINNRLRESSINETLSRISSQEASNNG